MKLYSYVVDHDTGYAPNPFGGLCTLACCKYSKTGRRRNIVELAKEGDWIVGTGGKSGRTSGHGTIVYAMKVANTIPFADYCRYPRFRGRCDAGKPSPAEHWRMALISKHYFYFGGNAKQIPKRFSKIEKRGPGFKNKFTEAFVDDFVVWIMGHKRGRRGSPCAQSRETRRCAC
jgi:hypothetical protein